MTKALPIIPTVLKRARSALSCPSIHETPVLGCTEARLQAALLLKNPPAITSPGPEETLWNIEGVLNVTLALNPGLQSGHQVRVYHNGQPQIVRGTSFQLEEVYRGVHNIQVEIIDATGRLMIRSQTNRFYVQQNTIR
jgi:hypothetical protein